MTKRIEGLDLLRFIAAASVLMYHYFFIGPLEGNWPKGQYLDFAHIGDFGVDVFFIISGFVIPLSASGRTAGQFAKSRFLRLYPALIVCSIITAVTSAALPGVPAKDILYKWLASLSFFPDIFGQTYLSSVYWTLAIEVKFYIIVALLMIIGLWKRPNIVIPVWLALSFLNEFSLHNQAIHELFITQYAGHFIAGMLLYQLRNNIKSAFMPIGFLLSAILIWKSVTGIESWIGGTYNVRFTDIGTFLIAPFAILLVYYISNIEKINLPSRLLSTLGAMSYTLYLLHADLGFFERAMWQRWGIEHFPQLKIILTDPVITILAIISSLVLAAVVAIFCEPPLRRRLRSLLDFKVHPSTSASESVARK